MASEKLSRDNAATKEEKVHVERAKVPQMTTHFESLSVKDSAAPGGRVREERGSLSRPTQGQVDETKEETDLLKGIGKFEGDFGEGGENKGFSNEELSGYRQQAQQGSIDALRGAQERYNQAKATTASTLQGFKDTVLEKGAQAKEAVLGKGTEGAQRGGDLKDTTLEKSDQEKDTMGWKGSEVKDTTLEKGAQAKDTLTEGAQKTAQYVSERGGALKDTALEKGAQAKDALAGGVQRTAQYVGEKGGVVKDTTLDKGVVAKDTLVKGAQKTGQYLGEKGQVAKEGTVSYAGKAKDVVVGAAVEVKDRAAVAGWTAAHYATDLTVEGTKMAADVAKGVAGFAGEKAVVAKDVVANVGQKAVGYTGETVGVVKDKVVETQESVRDYAARKKEEAQRGLEAKKTGQQKVGTGEQETRGGERSMVEEVVQKPKETVSVFSQGEEQHQIRGQGDGESGGVFQAIGETIAEIAHTTKDLVIGEDEDGNQGEKTTMSQQT